MTPKPVAKDLHYYPTLTSNYSLRNLDGVKGAVLKACSTHANAMNAIDDIRQFGSGIDIQHLDDPGFTGELNEIVRYFNSMSGELQEIMAEVAGNLKRYLEGGSSSRSRTFFEFQDMIKTATSAKRRRHQEEKEMVRRNARYDIEAIIKGDLDEDEKVSRIHAIVLKMESFVCKTIAANDDK